VGEEMPMTGEAKLSRQPAYSRSWQTWLVQGRFCSSSQDNSSQGASHLTGYSRGTRVPDGSTAR